MFKKKTLKKLYKKWLEEQSEALAIADGEKPALKLVSLVGYFILLVNHLSEKWNKI